MAVRFAVIGAILLAVNVFTHPHYLWSLWAIGGMSLALVMRAVRTLLLRNVFSRWQEQRLAQNSGVCREPQPLGQPSQRAAGHDRLRRRQVIAAAVGHKTERRAQQAGGQIVSHLQPRAHRNAKTGDRRLQAEIEMIKALLWMPHKATPVAAPNATRHPAG